METDAIATLLRDVADEVINPRFRSLASGEVMEKNPGDLVTVADREAEVILTRELLAAYPDAVVLGEEATSADPTRRAAFAAADHAFTVDPVDGTKNFVQGKADHAVMVAELRAGEVVRSWIWQPQHGRMYIAERGAGAFRDGERLAVPARGGDADPATWRGVTSRRSWLGESLPGLAPLELTWVCCGVDYPQLVAGAADYILYFASNAWDHAPGLLLLTEAGGTLTTHDGERYDARGGPEVALLAAGSPEIRDTVVPLLRRR